MFWVTPNTGAHPMSIIPVSALEPENPPDLIDEIVDGEVDRPPWSITAPGVAEWAMGKVAELDDRIRDVEAHALEMRARVDQWVEDQLNTRVIIDGGRAFPSVMEQRAFFASHLTAYAIDQREASGKATVQLVNGTVPTTKHSPKIEIVDEAALTVWALENEPSLVRTRHDVQVSTLRERVKATDGGFLVIPLVADKNGEPVEEDAAVVDEIPGVAVTDEYVTSPGPRPNRLEVTR